MRAYSKPSDPAGPGMTIERYEAIMMDQDLYLTKDEVKAGWHFCIDWDDMLIHKDWPEFQSCSCYKSAT